MATRTFHRCPACNNAKAVPILSDPKGRHVAVCLCSWCAHLCFEEVDGMSLSLSPEHIRFLVRNRTWPQLALCQRMIRMSVPLELAVADLSAESTEAARKPSAEFYDEPPAWQLYLRGVVWCGMLAMPWFCVVVALRWWAGK